MIFPWQQELWDQLGQLQTSAIVPHAILLAGTRHSGLETLGGSFMQLLMCAGPEGGAACKKCRSCELYSSRSHPDGFRLSPLEESRQILIEQIRDLVHRITLSAITARRKVALIYPAEAMNHNSQNALLKTLEEPAGSSVIILVSNDPGRLLPTIRSRCRLFSQAPPDKQQLLGWLEETATDSDAKLRLAACAAAGNQPLLALKYLQDGTLEQRREVAKVLFQMARGGGNALQAANMFSDFPKPDLWLWISGWMGALARVLLSGGEAEDRIVEAFRTSQPGMTPKRALQLQELAMRSYHLNERPIRQDLLLADWLIQWQSIS